MKDRTKANRKYNNMNVVKEEDKYFWIIVLVFSLLTLIMNLPAVTENLIIYIGIFVLRDLIFAGTVIGYSFFCNKPQRLTGVGVVIAIISIFGYLVMDFISKKAELNILFCLIVANIVYSLAEFIKNSKKSKVTFGLAIYFGLIYMLNGQYFGFSDESVRFYIIAGVLSIIASISIIYLFIKNKSLKALEITDKISTIFLTICFSFAFIFSSYANLNYSLDLSEPTKANCIIADKFYIHSYRSPESYKFSFELDGKVVEVEVEESDYSKYDIGDKFTLNHSKGFFNDEYYYAYE